jgi:subtilase family serine protease
MTTRSWIRNLFARTPRSLRNNLAGYRPRLEVLEDRLAPAFLTPSQVTQAYGINNISFGGTPGTGAGQTIAIIDGGDDAAMLDSTDPNFSTSDLATFDNKTGLLDPPSFKVVGETGGARPSYIGIQNIKESDTTAPKTATVTTTSPHGLSVGDTVTIVGAMVSGVNAYDGQYSVTSVPTTTSFTYTALFSGLGTATGGTINNPVTTFETSLDVEWAHAMAPKANIVLVELTQYTATDIVTAITSAVPNVGATVVSMSIGGSEFQGQTSPYTTLLHDGLFQMPGVSFVASSGDNGEPGDYPAFSPNVLAVGATNLNLDSAGSYGSETGWSNPVNPGFNAGGSGGGISQFESQPAYQQGTVTKVPASMSTVNGTAYRTSPDVSFVGGDGSPVEVWDSLEIAGFFEGGGGTSLSAPCWAGLTAIADQGLALRHLPSLNSSATGFTGQTTLQTLLYNAPLPFFHDITSGNNGSSAGTGYDLVTGIGTPVANLLIPYLGGFAPLSLKSIGTTILDATSNGTPTGAAGESVYDTTTLSGAMAGVPVTGTVTYRLFPNANGTGTPISEQTVTVNADGTVPNSPSTGPLRPGSYSYVAVYSGHSFYQRSASAVEPLTIKPTLIITAANESKIYGTTFLPDGTSQFTASGLVNGDTISSVTLASSGYAATANVTSPGPNYTITPSALVFSAGSASNYAITYVTGTLTVNPRPLTITAGNQSKTYGQTFIFLQPPFSVGATTTTPPAGLVNGDSVIGISESSDGAAATATVTSPGPNYALIPSNAEFFGGIYGPGPAGNYSITYVNGTLTVNPAPLTITATNQSKTYGAALTPAGTEFTTGAGQLLNGDKVTSVTLSSSGYAATATVTTPGPNYSITPSAAVGPAVGNYSITYVSGMLTVNTRPLLITASNSSKTYGQLIVLSPPAFSVGGGGLVNGDSINSTLMLETSDGAAATAGAANYPIDISGAQFWGGAAVAGNYSITYLNGYLTVLPAPLTITATNQSKTYGMTLTPAGTEFTTGAGQLLNGDKVTSVTLSSDGYAATATVTPPGPNYLITPSESVFSPSASSYNYTITFVIGTLTVNPLTAANLQAVLASTTSVTLAAATTSDAQTALTAVNSLTSPASPVTITVNLASGSFTDLTASPPAGVTLVLNGNGTTTTIVGHSPALQVTQAQGSVLVTNATFTTDTDAPTILVSGGSLTLRNVTIQESTGFTDAAISLTGGSLDLGTATDLGHNILNVNGTGEFVHNTTGSSIPAFGDTFEVNGVPIAALYLSFTSLGSSATTTAYGQAVTLAASIRANSTPGSGTPTGSVDFFDVSTNTKLGSVSLSGGSASLTTTALGVGQHQIRASYSGDSNFTVSLDALTQTVLGTGVTLIGTQLFIVGGSSSNDQVQVSPVGTSPTGSTGVQVKAKLNGVTTTTTFSQSGLSLQIVGYSGNDTIVLDPRLTVTAAISAGNGNDTVQAGSGTLCVTLGNGNDNVALGGGNNTVTLGNGNDNVQLGNGNNVVVTGNGNNTIQAGNGDNLIAAGLGQHAVQVGNGSNILIDGSVSLTQSGDSLGHVLNEWIQSGAAAAASIRSELAVTYNTSHANTLHAGSGLDWFWETYSQDTSNRKPGDLLN